MSTLPADLRQQVIDTSQLAFTAGVAGSLAATGIVTIVATALVMIIWPRRPARVAASDPERSGHPD